MNTLEQHSGKLLASRDTQFAIFPLTAGIVTAAFGVLTLLGWVFGWTLLTRFSSNFIPMAPSTALLFVLFGVAICLRAQTPLSRPSRWGSGALVGLVTLFVLLLPIFSVLNIHWKVEHLGLNITAMFNQVQIGHMSSVSGVCFLLSSASFFASLSPSAMRGWREWLVLIPASILLCVGFVFLLGYGFGTPLLYSSTFIPPAFNTILAFISLGLALTNLPQQLGERLSESPLGAFSQLHIHRFAIILVPVAIGIVTSGYAYYRHIERNFEANVKEQHTAISDLKVSDLVSYREERLNDGTALQNPTLTKLVRRFLAAGDKDAQQQLQGWLSRYPTLYDYERVSLLDTQGVKRLSLPADQHPVTLNLAQGASEALRTGQVTFQDFYRSEHNQRIYLAVLVPIIDETNGNKPLGLIVMQINPEKYLYPFINRWPLQSKLAETLLVRKEGQEVVFLNELRFKKNSALNLRVPLTVSNMPAVMGALGQRGIVHGIDYQGLPVISSIKAIPDSPWLLVARWDKAEIVAQLKAQFWQVLFMIATLLFATFAGVVAVWRQQQNLIYRQGMAQSEELQRTQNLLSTAEKIG